MLKDASSQLEESLLEYANMFNGFSLLNLKKILSHEKRKV